MKSTKVKVLLAVLLTCILVGMFMALGSAHVLPDGLKVLLPVASSAIPVSTATVAPAPMATEMATLPPPTATPTPSPSPTPTPTVAPTPTPDPDAIYYSDVETVYISPEKDHWTYKGPALYVDIKKITQTKPSKLLYYVADVRTRDVSLFRVYSSGKSRLVPQQIAMKNKAIIAVTADLLTEPYVNPDNNYKKGIIIRNGKLVTDRKGPSDTLAMLPGGVFEIFKPKETTPQKLLALGVQNAFSFGPGLVRDGVEMPKLQQHPLKNRNPRTGAGMVSPGHYIFIVMTGREPKTSVGVTLSDFAKLFLSYGCTEAYNFDGGQSASICFMGKQLNIMHVQADGVGQRRLPELFGFGTSELVTGK